MKKYCEKGSKRMLQRLMNEHSEKLNDLFEPNLKWISPTKDERGVFHEHQLNNKDVMEQLGLKKGVWKGGFWPTKQPTWDGILINKNGKENFDTVYLIEAKSHINEPFRRSNRKGLSDKQKENDDMISKSIQSVAKSTFGVEIGQNDENWMIKYYQVANRLAFQHKLKELLGKDVKLIFLNFINDPLWNENKKVDDWEDKYNKVFEDMRLDRKCVETQDVNIVYVDASSYEK